MDIQAERTSDPDIDIAANILVNIQVNVTTNTFLYTKTNLDDLCCC